MLDVLKMTQGRLNGLRALRDGARNMPGSPGMNDPLEKAGLIVWDRPANTYRLTDEGRAVLQRWEACEPPNVGIEPPKVGSNDGLGPL